MSPRVTPRHSRTSSIEAIANAASFVQPYKAQIIYGARTLHPSCPGKPSECQALCSCARRTSPLMFRRLSL